MSATSSRRPRRPAWHAARAPARDGDARRGTRRGAPLQRGRYVDGILVQSPAAEGDGRGRGAASVRRDRSQQGRRRLQPDLRGPARAEPRRLRAVHARGRHRAARTQLDSDRGQARRRDRPLRHRRQADGLAAAAQERDRHDLPLAHARSARDGAHGRHPRRGDRPPRVRDTGVREARRRRDRRRHQQRHFLRRSTAHLRSAAREARDLRAGVARCSSATFIPTWRTSRAR